MNQLVQRHYEQSAGHLDNVHLDQNEVVHQSQSQGAERLDKSRSPGIEVELSSSPAPQGVDRLDNRPGPTMGTGNPSTFLHPVGASVLYLDRSGQNQQAIVEGIVEWPGLPEEIAYRITIQLVPPSQVKEFSRQTR